LPLETDSRVKRAMARTLSKIPGIAQVPDLNRLLDDASPVVVREAADAISRRATVVAQDAALQKATVQKLQATITRLPEQSAFAEARRMCAEALKKLNAQAAMEFGRQLLDSPDLAQRAAGLTVLGETGPRTAGLIMGTVDRHGGQDPASIRVRRSGMDALARAGDFNFTADWLFNRFTGRNEPNADVRAAARNAYRTLLPQGDINKLLAEAGRLRDDARMRVDILNVLVVRFKGAGQFEDAAIQQVSLGKEYMSLSPPDAVAAAAVRQEALNYYLFVRKDGPFVLEPLVTGLTESLLKSQQYAKLAAMAQNLFDKLKGQDRYQQIIGSKVRNEAQALQLSTGPNKQKDWANAAQLIDVVSHMDPPLARTYLLDLQDISAKLKEQQRAATRPAGRR
jgi:hypothetical protein